MKKEPRSIKVNMIMNVILSLSSVLFPLITYPYISRILLPAGVGKVYFATSVVTYFAMFAQIGIPVYGVKACAKVRDDFRKLSETASELVSLNALLCIPVCAVYIAAVMTVPRLRADMLLYFIMGVSIVLNALNTDWFYQAIEEYAYITTRSLTFKTIALAGMFLLVHDPQDYAVYGGITIFAVSASSILNLYNIRKHIRLTLTSLGRLTSHIRPALAMFMLSVMTTIYTNLDSVMLGFMTDDASVGCYGTAVRIKLVLVSIITAATAVLLPRASYHYDNGSFGSFSCTIRRTASLTALVSIPTAAYFMIYAKACILVLAGDTFESAVLCMQIIMPTVAIIGFSNILGLQVLVPAGREKDTVTSVTIGAIIDLVLNAILIPRFGSAGASIGTLAAEIAVLSYLAFKVRRMGLEIIKKLSLGKITGATLAASIVSNTLLRGIDSAFSLLAASAIMFYLTYFVVLLIEKEEIITELWLDIRRKMKTE